MELMFKGYDNKWHIIKLERNLHKNLIEKLLKKDGIKIDLKKSDINYLTNLYEKKLGD